MKKLLTRSITGLIYVGIILAGLLGGARQLMLALCLLFGALGVAEFHKLTCGGNGKGWLPLSIDLVGAVTLISMPFAVVGGYVDMAVMMSVYLMYIIVRLVSQLYVREKSPLASLAYSLMSQLYIALPLTLMALVYLVFPKGNILLLAVFVMIWVNDTGAFIVGCSIGRHRLFERISPKKSWEGFWGGMAFSVGASMAFYYLCPEIFAVMGLTATIGLGVIVSVFATWGDLVESLIKRTLDVKDSGNILPGHGGILDRIDSLLLVIPAMLCYIIIIDCF